ncbi:MAG TPA: hypothetical protein VG844_17605 [Terracidiphilus sp.]|nr:hypothetical protein [Terracidiphilus sp.]
MIRAFLDESGTHPETPVLGVAGCYAEEERWCQFREVWLPHSQNFHAKNSSRLFPKLTEALRISGIQAVLVSVAKETYKNFATVHFKTAMGNAYSCCALSCVAQICSENSMYTTDFVLEAGQPNLSFVMSVLESMKDSGEWLIGSVIDAKKPDFIELHSADFVSHICSTYDKEWMEKLFALKILRHAHLTKNELENVSPKVTSLFRTAKAIRRAQRKEEQ